MRKINTSYRQIAVCLILLSYSLFIIHSCKKDRDKDLPLTKTELIAEAKSFFEDEIVTLPQLNDNNFRHSLNKTPLWDKASTRKISIGNAVIIPIKYEKETLLKPEGEQTPTSLAKSSYLMIYKNKQHEMQAEWVTVIADKTISNGNKFVGTIAIEDWNGKSKRGFAFGAEGDILPVYLNSATTYKKISYARSYTCFTIEHYGYVMGYPQIVGTETFCFSFGGGNNGAGNQWHENGVENDGNGTEPADYSYIVDCDNVINGTATWNTDCQTCIGGTTGITECPPLKVNVDPNARPCLEQIKSQLEALGLKNTSKSSGLIASVLNKLNLSTGANFNAIINERAVSSNFIAQTTEITNSNTYGTQGTTSEITFNSNYLDNMTDLAVAATMMHEYVHAYFDWNFHMIYRGEAGYDANFISSYNLLFKDGNPNSTPTTHHDQMAKSFASSISAMLKQYADEKKIPHPADPEYFNKMGWIGLMGTDAAKYAPAGTAYTLSAETKSGVTHLSQALNCKK